MHSAHGHVALLYVPDVLVRMNLSSIDPRRHDARPRAMMVYQVAMVDASMACRLATLDRLGGTR
jgi:hypothetical protein